MSLKLYFDLMSQPCRALYILLKNIEYDFTPMPIELQKGEHFSEEFTEVNRFRKVPVIDHNGFVLTESVAILKYLSQEGIIPESLFPRENKKAARVQEFLEWHHEGLRLHTGMYFRVKVIDPLITGTPVDTKQLEGYEKRLENALETFDKHWLGQGHKFLTGDKISVADLIAACEIEQPKMAGYDTTAKHAKIAAWLERVRTHFNPDYDEGHAAVYKIIRKQGKTL